MSISTIQSAAPIPTSTTSIPLLFIKGSAHLFESPTLSLEELTERIEHLELKVKKLTSQIKREEALTLAKQRPYVTIKEALNLYLPVSEKTVRWWIWSGTENFSDVVVRRGRRIWLDTQKLRAWIDAGGMRYVQSRG